MSSDVVIQTVISGGACLFLLVSTLITARLLLANRRPLLFVLVLVAMGGVFGSLAAVTHTTWERLCERPVAAVMGMKGSLEDALLHGGSTPAPSPCHESAGSEAETVV